MLPYLYLKMAGVVFYFDGLYKDVWSGSEEDLNAWNYNCKLADIDRAIIVNTSGMRVQSFDRDMDIQIVKSMPKLEGNVTQIVCPWEDTPQEKTELWDFDHNTDWYVFGPSNGWRGEYFGDNLVTIPQNGKGAHHALFIGTVVMYHRYKIVNS